MSITPELRAAARSAYRQLLRSAAFTFRGDDQIYRAFRAKIRNDALQAQNEVEPITYAQHALNAQEAAVFLRTNVVQASKNAESDSWRLRFTAQTELGSNDTIKSPPEVVSNRRQRKLDKASQSSLKDAPAHSPSPMYYSAMKKAHLQRVIPEIREEDLEEVFVRGSGPGGQSVNKTENNVQLHHKPTGIRVSCHETRSLAQNRMFARRKLVQKLDEIYNPGISKQEMRDAKERERARRRRKKAKKKVLKSELPETR